MLKTQSVTGRGRVGREEISIPLVSDSAGVNGKFSASLDILSSARDAFPCRTSVQPLRKWGDFKGKQVNGKCCTASGSELEHSVWSGVKD